MREPNLSCFCGQPIDATVPTESAHCTRCGLAIARSLAGDGYLDAAYGRVPGQALLAGSCG